MRREKRDVRSVGPFRKGPGAAGPNARAADGGAGLAELGRTGRGGALSVVQEAEDQSFSDEEDDGDGLGDLLRSGRSFSGQLENYGRNSLQRHPSKEMEVKRAVNMRAWIDEDPSLGPLVRRACEGKWMMNVSGYDLQQWLQKWLEKNGHGSESICEVILNGEKYKDIRRFVGKAYVFWSHMQKETFVHYDDDTFARLKLAHTHNVLTIGATFNNILEWRLRKQEMD